MRKKDIVHFLGTENLPHFIHSCSFLLVLSSSLSSSMKHCNTHKCTLFVHNLRATYQGTYILIFVQFPRYRLFLYPFGWRLSGKKKKFPQGAQNQTRYSVSQSPTYLDSLIQLYLIPFWSLNIPRAFALAIPLAWKALLSESCCFLSFKPWLTLLEEEERLFLTTKLYHIKTHSAI